MEHALASNLLKATFLLCTAFFSCSTRDWFRSCSFRRIPALYSRDRDSNPNPEMYLTLDERPFSPAIHSHKDYNTQKTPYLRSGMSDTSGERRWRTQAKLEPGHCYIPSRERRQTGKKADHIGERTEKLSFAERTNPPYRPPYSLSIKKSLREARRAKPLMSWRRLYLRKSAKLRFRMCYILSIERQLLRKAFIPLWKK